VLSQCSFYTTKRSSYCIVTVQFLYYKTVQLLYCHSAVPILQNSPATVLSQCSSYTTKRSSYCIVTVQFLYYKTVQLLYCHSAVPILQNGPFTVLLQCSSYTRSCEKQLLASSCLSVRPVWWNSWETTGRIFIKFDFLNFFSKILQIFHFSLNSDQ